MIDLLSSMTTGTAASLGVSLVLRPMWTLFGSRARQHQHQNFIPVTGRSEAKYIVSHAVAGAFQGWLFWLSWGLAAISITSWWMHGLIVGFTLSIMLVIPLILAVSCVIRLSNVIWMILIGETLVTCIAVALACSWMWAHGR